MRVHLTQQAKEILGQSDLVMITERVDDVALLIGQMGRMGFVEVLDRHLPRHWKQRRLSWGWTAVIWLAYILTEGDHRKVTVAAYLQGMQHTLSHLSGQRIAPLDFSDDRLGHLLTHFSQAKYWHAIEQDVNACSIQVYALAQDVIRCDATTVSGDHQVTAEGVLQFGHSKDDPTQPQIKVMRGALDPLGMPLATDVLAGERADDGLYIPIIKRIEAGLPPGGLLFVGDCKMSACATRAYMVGRQHVYLAPLPLTGGTADAMAQWIDEGIAKAREGALTPIMRVNPDGTAVLVAAGYERERPCALAGSATSWSERVLIVRSPVHAAQQAVGLEKRLVHAAHKLAALTPARGRGKRQLTDEVTLREAIARVLQEQRVEGLLTVAWERQVEQQIRYVGRGRGSARRAQQVRERIRYHIPGIAREEDLIAGLTYLLTLGVRVLTVMEFVLRRSLHNAQAPLPGVHPENGKKMTNMPTAERILKAFPGVSLTILQTATGEELRRWLTPLSALQQAILYGLGLTPSL